MRLAALLVFEPDRLEVGDVVGDDCSPVFLGACEDVLVGRVSVASFVLGFSGGDHVMAAVAELDGDLVVPEFVEQ